jgi:putative flippase GtrA
VNPPVSAKPMLFVAVGSTAALVHFSIVFFLVEYCSFFPASANAIAFPIAFLVSFFGHRRFSFVSDGKTGQHFWKWLQVSILGFAANQGLYLLGLNVLPHAWYLAILIVVTATIAIVSYFLGKIWAFNV